MYSTMGSHSGTLMYSVMLSHSGTLMYSVIESHSGTLNVQCGNSILQRLALPTFLYISVPEWLSITLRARMAPHCTVH